MEVLVDARPDDTHSSTVAPLRWHERGTIIAGMLLAFYLAASLLLDTSAHLTTDVGGKVASLEAMTTRGDWDPDIGYWFAEADPDGVLFPFGKTRLTEQNQWVNTTTFTMVMPARPLWASGGLRAALLIPMLSAVVAAAAAGALERRFDRSSNGSWSMWCIGLASPAAIYALDFWEHAPGLAAMSLGLVAVIDAQRPDGRWWHAAAAGLAFGFAATMRQEALVYGFVAGIVLLVGVYRHRGLVSAALRGALMAGGTVAMLAAHALAELVLTGGTVRAARATGTIAATDSNLDQINAGFITTFFPINGAHPFWYGFAAAMAATLAWLTHRVIGKQTLGPAIRLTSLIWGTWALLLLVGGPRFVPGMVPTAPLVVAGVVAAIHRRAWLPLALGLAPLPLVLATAFSDGSFAQWGGRYHLLTGLVLVVLGISLLRPHAPRFVLALAAAGFVITMFGIGWSIERSHRVGDTWTAVASQSEPGDDVVVWENTLNSREAGAELIGRRWLGAPDATAQKLLADLLRSEDIDSFIWIDAQGGPLEAFVGFEAGAELGELEFFSLRMTRFHRN